MAPNAGPPTWRIIKWLTWFLYFCFQCRLKIRGCTSRITFVEHFMFSSIVGIWHVYSFKKRHNLFLSIVKRKHAVNRLNLGVNVLGQSIIIPRTDWLLCRRNLLFNTHNYHPSMHVWMLSFIWEQNLDKCLDIRCSFS